MGKLLTVGTFGTDDPTRATMPFLVASGRLTGVTSRSSC